MLVLMRTYCSSEDQDGHRKEDRLDVAGATGLLHSMVEKNEELCALKAKFSNV